MHLEVFDLLPSPLRVLTLGVRWVRTSVLRDDQMGLHHLICNQYAGAASIDHAVLAERVLNLLDLYLFSLQQVELVEHLAERIRIVKDGLHLRLIFLILKASHIIIRL